MANDIPSMLHEDRAEFAAAELAALEADLRALENPERVAYRDRNARDIAASEVEHLLIVAGPGTGKSHLFLDRIQNWLRRFPGELVYVSTFVRKLVQDLTSDLDTSHLAPAERALVRVTTLHGLARSIIERNRGTSEFPMKPYIRIIGQAWKDMVWGDVLSLQENPPVVPFEDLETQFHRLEPSDVEPWPTLRRSYFEVCQFYNVAGFADSILHATEALRENPDLSGHALWIIDEFQDFNVAERRLIRICTRGALGVLLAGDDDQALYQDLKSSLPGIIRAEYEDTSVGKAMLPYCGRSSFHICSAATAFLDAEREPGSIPKVFLPLEVDEQAQRVQVVVCSDPKRAVDYVTEFIEEHRAKIDERRVQILAGNSKDPFLLILSPTRDVDVYYGGAAARLDDAVDEWRLDTVGPEADFIRVITYCGASKYPDDNFSLRLGACL
jgi:superfamily I DNA/RNA helicase